MRKSHWALVPLIVGLMISFNSLAHAGSLKIEPVSSVDSYNEKFLSLKEDKILGYNKLSKKLEYVDVKVLIDRLAKEGVYPVDKEYLNVTSNFGYRGSFNRSMEVYDALEKMPFHAGTDIAAAGILRAKAYSVVDGVVEKIEISNTGYGNLVIINSGNFKSYYAHLDSIAPNLRQGDRVRSGDLIGRVGNTGRSTGPHLHLEFNIGDVALNPEVVLPYIKGFPNRIDRIEPQREIAEKPREEKTRKENSQSQAVKKEERKKPASILERSKQIDMNEFVEVPSSKTGGYGFAFDIHLESVRNDH